MHTFYQLEEKIYAFSPFLLSLSIIFFPMLFGHIFARIIHVLLQNTWIEYTEDLF